MWLILSGCIRGHVLVQALQRKKVPFPFLTGCTPGPAWPHKEKRSRRQNFIVKFFTHTHTHSERSEQATPRLLQECTNQRSPVRNSEGRGGNRNIKINTQQETDVTVKCAVPLSLQSRTERNGRLTSPEILTLQC